MLLSVSHRVGYLLPDHISSVRRDLIGLGDVTAPPASTSSITLPIPDLASSKPPSTASSTTSSPAKIKTPSPRARASAQPDLLIVAGSSLKVPGTKRIVREFAKAVQATSRAGTPSGSRSRTTNVTLNGSSPQSDRTLVDSHSSQQASDNESATSASGSTSLASSSPRTIYLNLDFPVPTRDWKGVFDVWVQGDVQAVVGAVKRKLEERDAQTAAGTADDASENSKSKPKVSRKRKVTLLTRMQDDEQSTASTEKKSSNPPKKRKTATSVPEQVTKVAKPRKVSSSSLKTRATSPSSSSMTRSVSNTSTHHEHHDDSAMPHVPVKLEADDDPTLAAAQSLLALSCSPSPPLYRDVSTSPKRHLGNHILQHHNPASATSTPLIYPSLSLDSDRRRSSASVGHKRARFGSGDWSHSRPSYASEVPRSHLSTTASPTTSSLRLEGSLPPPVPTVSSSRLVNQLPSHSMSTSLPRSSLSSAAPGRIQPGFLVRSSGSTAARSNAGYTSSRTSASTSSHTGAPTIPVSQVMPAKKRARKNADGKNKSISTIEAVASSALHYDSHGSSVDSDPESAALIRKMSLGLRERGR